MTSKSYAFLGLGLALAVSGIGSATAATYLTIDGRDSANLAGDGNHGTFHNPPVNFAFTFGGVAADNPNAGPGDPPRTPSGASISPATISARWASVRHRLATSPSPGRWSSRSISR